MTAVLGERPRTWRAISRPYRPGIATSTMRTSGLRRSTSDTTDRPSAVSPTTSKSGSSSSRHLSASRTTFWSSASTIRVVARLPDALSPFFTVSVRSTLSLGAGGPQEGIRRSTHRVYSYTYRLQASYPRRPLDTCVHESAQSRQKFSQASAPTHVTTRTYAWHAAGRTLSIRPSGGCMTISGKAVRPRTLDVIPSVPRLAGLRPPPVHILVIEDHDDTRDVLDMLLRTEGYEVTLAVDGLDGLEKYRQRPADIVLVDIFMPRKNG